MRGAVIRVSRRHAPLSEPKLQKILDTTVATLTLSGDQMFDIVARILPAATTITFVSLSMFNVGYFWKIGLHFLGIVDLNNIVYSFGLTLGLWMVLVFVGLNVVDILFEAMSETSIRRSMRTSTFFWWVGITLSLLALLTPEPWINEIVQVGVTLVGFILALGASSVRAILDYKTSGTAKPHDLAFLVPLPFVIFFYTGTLVAAWQMSQLNTYTT